MAEKRRKYTHIDCFSDEGKSTMAARRFCYDAVFTVILDNTPTIVFSPTHR